jgi:hypothetical protein
MPKQPIVVLDLPKMESLYMRFKAKPKSKRVGMPGVIAENFR